MPFLPRPALRRRARPRLFPSPAFLGIDPSVDAMFPAVSSRAGFTQKDKQNFETWVDSGYLPAYYKKTPGDCGTAGTSLPATLKITPALSVGGSALLKAGALTMNPIIAGAGAALAVLGDIFGIFGGHHAQAVAQEQSTLCDIVPAVNQALGVIDQALPAGQMTPDQAGQALDNIYSAYQTAVSKIVKDNASECNAACVYGRALRGIIAQRKLNLQNMPASADQSSAASATAGLPSWLPWAVGGFLVWQLI